ncbi:MAG: hypothetical protein IPG22_05960 [Acidobacteria bacterium]|nr:hypothetical protein [Acidobacteriota bacterium]
MEQDLLRNALAINNNNQTRAAQQLGLAVPDCKEPDVYHDWCENVRTGLLLTLRRLFANQSKLQSLGAKNQ